MGVAGVDPDRLHLAAARARSGLDALLLQQVPPQHHQVRHCPIHRLEVRSDSIKGLIFNFGSTQSISVIRPAVLAGEIGPYKQIGPVSSTLVER